MTYIVLKAPLNSNQPTNRNVKSIDGSVLSITILLAMALSLPLHLRVN